MKATLMLAGLVVCAYTYFFVTALLFFSGEGVTVAAEQEFRFNADFLNVMLYPIVLVVPAHFFLVYRYYKANMLELAHAVPYFVIPYMLGITVQAMIL